MDLIPEIEAGFRAYSEGKVVVPPVGGMMLLFSQQTGSTECILLDEGYLTNVRTAVAGAMFLVPGLKIS